MAVRNAEMIQYQEMISVLVITEIDRITFLIESVGNNFRKITFNTKIQELLGDEEEGTVPLTY